MASTVTFECEWCGDEAEQRKVQYDKRDHHFCSLSCANKWQARDKPELVCENCGNTYTIQPFHANESRFCSAECRDTYSPKGKVTLECEYCEDEYEVYPSREDRSRFCSADCRLEWMHETYKGENHPNFVEGNTGWYGSEWEERRQEALERDEYECVACGKPKEETVQMGIHHITPYRMFDDDTDAHKLDNLVTLCRSCHSKWEGIPVNPGEVDGDYSDFS